VNAEPEQNRNAVRIACDTAADADPFSRGMCPFHRVRNEMQHTGTESIDLRRELWMTAVHCERVLRKVVRSDGKEIGLARKLRGHDRGGGNFHHDAGWNGLYAEAHCFFVQNRLYLA